MVWLAATAHLARSGVLSNFEGRPPRIMLLFLPMLAASVLLGFSRVGTALTTLPIAALVAAQGFRLPLELVMHQAAVEGTMPPQMTYTGYNFDIATGASALLVATLALFGRAPRWLLIAWNGLGSLLLLAILTIAVVSLPVFGLFGREPERLNTWIAYFPYVWLPAALVSAAVLGHVLLWRRLLAHGNARP